MTAFAIALGIGLAFGLIQGFLVAYLEIQPFIVTLAAGFFSRGLTTIIHAEPFNVQNEAFLALKDTRLTIPFLGSPNNAGVFTPAYMEIGVAVALILVVLAFVLLRWTSLGRSFYALGGNRQSALMLGINTKRSLFLAHVISGLLAGIAGFVYIMHSASGAVTNAEGMEMNAIAASIIGGYDAHRRRGQHHRHVLRRPLAGHHPEHRLLRRLLRRLVGQDHRCRDDLPVPRHPERGSGQKEANGVTLRSLTVAPSLAGRRPPFPSPAPTPLLPGGAKGH